MNNILIIVGAAVIILWGIAHLIPTRNIVNGFGEISADNRKIIAMESMAEGVTLIFLGVLPLLVNLIADEPGQVASIVYLACALMLLVMAGLTLSTGARTPTIWYKVCPAVKTVAAVLFILGNVL